MALVRLSAATPYAYQGYLMKLLRPRISAREWLQSATLFLLLFLTSAVPRAEESQHDILFFTSVDTFRNSDLSDPDLDESFVRPAVDILYSYSGAVTAAQARTSQLTFACCQPLLLTGICWGCGGIFAAFRV